LAKADPLSITYYSLMSPQYINKKYIVGKPVFRFWPANRLGKV
jgi:signal peptidase I